MSKETKNLWDRIDGLGSGSFTDEELKLALRQLNAAMPYLQSRLPKYMLAFQDAAQTEAKLMSFAHARGIHGEICEERDRDAERTRSLWT